MLNSQSIKMPGLLLFLYDQLSQCCRALVGYFYDKPASLFRSGLQHPLRWAFDYIFFKDTHAID